MFAVIALPFEAYQDLPSAEFKLLAALSRYVDREGRCYPTLRQLARDVLMPLTTVWRHLNALGERGCFSRARRGRGRFYYELAEPYRPRWPERVSPKVEHRVPQDETQEARPLKHQERARVRARFASQEKGGQLPDDRGQWEMRLRSWRKSRFWMPYWGPKPTEPGCFVPALLLGGGDHG